MGVLKAKENPPRKNHYGGNLCTYSNHILGKTVSDFLGPLLLIGVDFLSFLFQRHKMGSGLN
jgi:hypothetical protein